VLRGAPVGAAQFDYSQTGTLVYVPGPVSPEKGQFLLAYLTTDGKSQALKLPRANYRYPRVSRDGKRLAYQIDDGKESSIWVYELSGANAPRRLTFQGASRYPLWSADGERIAYQSDREGDLGIFWQRADGTGAVERLTKPQKGEGHIPDSFSSDGRYLSFSAGQGGVISVWVLSLGDRKTSLFAEAPSARAEASIFSPDGHWIAYSVPSDAATGIYVQPFPANGAKYQVSSGVGPMWSSDGKRIYFSTGPAVGGFVSVSTSGGMAFSAVSPLATGLTIGSPFGPRNRDILPDGQFIVMMAALEGMTGAEVKPPIELVLNWFEELKQRVPGK
jgi:Tol biopolymer transport system component